MNDYSIPVLIAVAAAAAQGTFIAAWTFKALKDTAR